jgi:hypothetical protein
VAVWRYKAKTRLAASLWTARSGFVDSRLKPSERVSRLREAQEELIQEVVEGFRDGVVTDVEKLRPGFRVESKYVGYCVRANNQMAVEWYGTSKNRNVAIAAHFDSKKQVDTRCVRLNTEWASESADWYVKYRVEPPIREAVMTDPIWAGRELATGKLTGWDVARVAGRAALWIPKVAFVAAFELVDIDIRNELKAAGPSSSAP